MPNDLWKTSGRTVESIEKPMRRLHNSRIYSSLTRTFLSFTLGVFGLQGGAANAQLTLTQSSVNAGWTLKNFVTGFVPNGNGQGPIGIAFTDTGVMVDAAAGEVYLLPDTDGQTLPAAAQTYSPFHPWGLARIGSSYYVATNEGATVAQLNENGSYDQLIVGDSATVGALSLAVNPNNGHLFVSLYSADWITDIDPIKKTATIFLTLPTGDNGSYSLATDGTTLYVPTKNHILGYRISDKTLVFDSGFITANGMAMGSGSLSGNLYFDAAGDLFQMNLSTKLVTLLACGGSRGDAITVDPKGSLLITQSDRIVRLVPPSGVAFETASLLFPSSTVPGSLPVTGTVKLGVPAPAPVKVALTSSNADFTVPTTVTIPAGSTTATFSATTKAVAVNTSVVVTTSLNGVNSSVNLSLQPVALQSIALSSASVKGGGTVTATVSLDAIASLSAVPITFTSTDAAIVGAPGATSIPIGKQTVQIEVPTKVVTANTNVTISVIANGITKTANLLVAP